jgi:protein-tyrosine phosphatase
VLRALSLLPLLCWAACYPQFEVRERRGGHESATPEPLGGNGGEATSPEAAGEPGQSGDAGGARGVVRECSRGESLLVGHVTNLRDLGGIPVATGQVACGVLYRGAPLKGLGPEGCNEVAELGLETVIDLRTESERESAPSSACVQARSLLAPLPIPYGLGPADYLADLNSTASIAVVFHTLADPQAYPVYFHCTFGRDRTGVLGALLLLALGATPEDVMADYMLSQSSVGAYPDSLQAVLDDIAARGGAEAVLNAAGVGSDELEALRARAISVAP